MSLRGGKQYLCTADKERNHASCVEVPKVIVDNPFEEYVQTVRRQTTPANRTAQLAAIAAQQQLFQVASPTGQRAAQQFYLSTHTVLPKGVYAVRFAPTAAELQSEQPFVLQRLDTKVMETHVVPAAQLQAVRNVGKFAKRLEPPLYQGTEVAELYAHPAKPQDRSLRLWRAPNGRYYTVRNGLSVLPFPDAGTARFERETLRRTADRTSIAHHLHSSVAFV